MRGLMNTLAIFGIGALMSLLSSTILATLYVWPRLAMERHRALVLLVAPHMFLRFIGLSFLVPGVVSSSLPLAFALPAACGDFVAGILAMIATIALARRVSWGIASVWLFNLWGATDLLFALYEGARTHMQPGALGAAFFIPTAIVPPLLVTHALIFRLLLRPKPLLNPTY
jgi:hypothetical protein